MLVLLFSPVASAATLSVCDTCTYTTISDAVAAAASGDTISIDADTYTEDVTVDRNLTIVGAGAGSTVLLDGGFDIEGGRTVTISALTVDRSTWGSAIAARGARLTLSAVEVANASPGVYLDSGSIVAVTGSSFAGNGEAFYLDGATLDIDDSTFTSNSSSSYGGAMDCYDAVVTIAGSTFSGNASGSGGDAIRIGADCTVSVTDSYFTGHSGSVIWNGHSLTLDGVRFVSNDGISVHGYEGAELDVTASLFDGNGNTPIAVFGPLTVTDSTFASNEGGAISHFEGACTIRGNRFLENVETGYGSGALYISTDGAVEIDGNYFAGNWGDIGGALAVFGGASTLSVTNNVACANYAGEGGAFWLGYGSGSFTVTNNVLVENVAYEGGGIWYDGSTATSSFVNNTLLGNEATYYDGGSAWLGTDFVWINDIVAHTVAGDGVSGGSSSSSTATLQYGDWYLNTTSDLGLGLALTPLDSTNITSDPLLTAWSADRDCTNDDFSLASGSPAIDAGDPSYTDPDGTRSDIGACGGPGADCSDADGDGVMVVIDCDDADASVHPGAPEPCDGLDHDCDGLAGGGDFDGDGTVLCLDCDDTNASIAPGADELCDGWDNDCDGVVDEDGATWGTTWYEDADGDGYGWTTSRVTACECPSGYTVLPNDCDDGDAGRNPGNEEIWYDGIDQDCRGGDDFDQDRDREQSDAHGGTDCDDLDPDVNTEAYDVPGDGIDSDCDGADAIVPADTDEPEDAEDTDERAPRQPPGDDDPTKCGCSAAPAPGGALLAVVALLMARRRRSQRP